MMTRRAARAMSASVLPALLLLASSGCGTQGKYTGEGAELAQKRMGQLKAGTDWQMANQQFLSGDLKKAIKNVDRSIANNPDVTKSHVLRGRVLMEQGKLEAAREAFLSAEKLDPKNVDAQYFLGIVSERVSEPEEAYRRYTKASELDANNPQYAVASAEMLVELQRYDEAKALLEQKQGQFAHNAAIRQTLGHLAMLRRDYTQAALLFNQALLLAPDDERITEDLLQAQMLGENFADAEFTVNRLMSFPTTQDRRDLQVMKARCLIGLDRPVEARSILLELTATPEFGSDATLWIDLGTVAGELKDRINLRNAGTRVMSMASQRPEGYMFRAQFLRLDSRAQEALSFIDQAIARSESNGAALAVKAQILRDLGRAGEAQAALASAVSADPTNKLVQDVSRAFAQPPVIVSHPDGQ